MEFVKLKPINRICPCCGNGNYMRMISGKNVGEINVKCINCNSYYNYDKLLKRDNSKPLNGANGRTMNDLISREVLLKDLSYCAPELWQDEEYIKAKIMKQHAVDAAPVVHARWIDIPDKPYWDQKMCSVCGDYFCCQNNFCPTCGAKMDEEVR